MDTRFENRIRVFLSSTFEDLQKEREEVIKALNKLPRIEPVNMEHFGARPRRPLEECLDAVAKSDVYVAILGNRYGSVDKESGISFTEKEYDKAYDEKRLPCYIYFLKYKKGMSVESDRNKEELERFKNKLLNRHWVYEEPKFEHLAKQITDDLTRDLGMDRDVVVDARDTLRLIALHDVPVTYNKLQELVKQTVFWSRRELPDKWFNELNKFRFGNAWEVLRELSIVYRIQNLIFDIDCQLRERLREQMADEPYRRELHELRKGFVDYFQKRLNEWKDVPPQMRESSLAESEPIESLQDVEDRKNYLRAFHIADNELHDGERVIKLAEGLVGNGYNGFLTYWHRFNEALVCTQSARNYAVKFDNRDAVASIDWKIAEIHFQRKEYQLALESFKRAESLFHKLNLLDQVEEIHERIAETESHLQGESK